ncbi:flippase [Porticoccaceae bacterium]|nr:flippase [Porticoccaceae bacterium]
MKISMPLLSSLWLIIEKLIYISVSLIVSVALARYLEPELFGRLHYLLALTSIVAPIMTLGLNSILSREVLHRPLDTTYILGSGIVLRFIAGLATAVIATWLATYFLGSVEHTLFSILVISSMFNAALVVDFWFQARNANMYGVIVRLVTLLIFSAARLWAIQLNAGLAVFIVLSALEFIGLALLYLLAYHRIGSGIDKLRVSFSESRRLLKEGRWLFLSGIAAVMYLKVDQIMLGSMQGDQAVGIYSAAIRISEVWYFIPAAIMTGFFPQLVTKKSRNQTGYAADLQRLNDVLITIAALVAVVITLIADWFLPLLFGKEYMDAVPILVVHIWAGLFVFMRSLLSKWLIVENYLKLSLLSQVLGATVNVVLNILLIPLYGPLGAAYATLVSYAVAAYGVLLLHPNLWPMAAIVTRSMLLPYRIVRKGYRLYQARY